MSKYKELRQIDVSAYVEKKGNLNYLSWAHALDLLMQNDPDAEWEHLDEIVRPDGTVMVYCKVTAFGKSRTAFLPVMDYKNKAIKNPDAFAVNTAMQRCFAKAVGLHGIGLSIYMGEDIRALSQYQATAPKNTKVNNQTAGGAAFDRLSEEMKQEALRAADEVDSAMPDVDKAIDVFEIFYTSFPDDEDVKVGTWYKVSSATRSAINARLKETERALQ